MLPSSFSNSSDSMDVREFEQHLRDGIYALKNGDRSLAKRLLDQAALMNSADARGMGLAFCNYGRSSRTADLP